MIGTKVAKAFNDQITEELYSAYLYLQMSAWFTSIDLHGFATWMRVQCQEEMVHASIFFDHILTRNGSLALQAIQAPPAKWDSPLAAAEAALKHEQHITACIYKLVDGPIPTAITPPPPCCSGSMPSRWRRKLTSMA